MVLTKKQTEAIDILEDKTTKELIFGGGAGSAKSFLGAYWLLKMSLKYPGTRWLMGRKKLKTLKETTLKSFYEVAKLQGLINGIHFIVNNQSNIIYFENGSEIIMKDLFHYPADPDFDELGSLEITGAFIDEVNQVVSKAWSIVKSRIRYKLDENNLIPKILGTCNPTKNWVYKDFYKPDKLGILEEKKKFIQALVTDNPFISQHYIDNLKDLPIQIKERLLFGNWEIDDDPSKLIEYDNILSIFSNDFLLELNKKESHYITCDVARLGSDKAVIIVWQGFVIKKIYEYDKSKITLLQKVIKELMIKYKVPNRNVIADEDGVGGGLIDNLRIKGFVNNSSALNDENYSNLKSQCYYKLADKIMSDEIYVEYDCPKEMEEDIITELEQVKSDNKDDGKLRIISKSKVKDHINRSPDYSDAMMMRMWWDLKPNVKKYNIF